MIRVYERIKDGESCGVDTSTVALTPAITEMVNSELGWGAKVTWLDDDNVEFRTKVFGCLDITKYTVDDTDRDLVRQVIDGYKDTGRNGVNAVILKYMNIEGGGQIYLFEDILVLLSLYEEGHGSKKLALLLAPVISKPTQASVHLPEIASPQLRDAIANLDGDDGARKIFAQAQLGLHLKVIDEAHHSVSKPLSKFKQGF